MLKQLGWLSLGIIFGVSILFAVFSWRPEIAEQLRFVQKAQITKQVLSSACLHEPDIEVTYPGDRSAAAPETPPEKTTFTVKNGSVTLVAFTLDGPRIAEMMKQMGCTIYFRASTTGLGGYILYAALADPWYRLNLSDAADESLTPLPVPSYFSIEDISPNQSMIAVSDHERHAVVILSMQGEELMRFAVPTEYEQFGDVAFSPNGKKVAYAAATGNPDDEQGEVFVIDLASKNQESVRGKIGGYFNLNGWRDNQSPYVIEH